MEYDSLEVYPVPSDGDNVEVGLFREDGGLVFSLVYDATTHKVTTNESAMGEVEFTLPEARRLFKRFVHETKNVRKLKNTNDISNEEINTWKI